MRIATVLVIKNRSSIKCWRLLCFGRGRLKRGSRRRALRPWLCLLARHLLSRNLLCLFFAHLLLVQSINCLVLTLLRAYKVPPGLGLGHPQVEVKHFLHVSSRLSPRTRFGSQTGSSRFPPLSAYAFWVANRLFALPAPLSAYGKCKETVRKVPNQVAPFMR